MDQVLVQLGTMFFTSDRGLCETKFDGIKCFIDICTKYGFCEEVLE